MKRILVALSLAIGAALIPAIAKADCGVHQIRAYAPKMLAMEAIPLTSANVNPADPRARRTVFPDVTPQACPDDSVAMQKATIIFWQLWHNAIDFQNRLEVQTDIEHNEVLDHPRACAPYYKADFPAGLLNRWWAFGTADFFPTSANDVARTIHALPYAHHVFQLWNELASRARVHLPPLLSDGRKQLAVIDSLEKTAEATQAHLPDGVECPKL